MKTYELNPVDYILSKIDVKDFKENEDGSTTFIFSDGGTISDEMLVNIAFFELDFSDYDEEELEDQFYIICEGLKKQLLLNQKRSERRS